MVNRSGKRNGSRQQQQHRCIKRSKRLVNANAASDEHQGHPHDGKVRQGRRARGRRGYRRCRADPQECQHDQWRLALIDTRLVYLLHHEHGLALT